jgi:hypothetical protein
MKKMVASLVAVAGLSVAAHAVDNTRMDVLVSLDGINWAPQVTAGQGSTVQVLVRASYIGTATPLGFASAVFQPTVSNWTAGDTALDYAAGGWGSNQTNSANMVPAGAAGAGQYGRIIPFGRTNLTTAQAITNHVHLNGAAGAPAGTSWLRIAQRQVTSWIGGTGNTTGGSGVNVAQLSDNGRTTLDPAFNPALQNVELFRFGITLGPAAGRDSLTVDLPLAGFGNRNSTTGEREVYWFATMVEASGSIRGTAIVNPGTILIPAPASLALLGLGGLAAARRRRA